MKKLLIVGLTLMLLASALFADDALVMPAMVGRFYVAPIFSFAPGVYDNDGNYHSFDDSISLFNLGFALEFGLTDWVTAAVQWVPGWTPWSDISGATPADNANTNGFGDIFAGAKIQIVGPNAPVQSTGSRFAFAPGIIIPMPGPDFEEEAKKAAEGREATLNSMDRHVFGFGSRFYFDYIINDNFFINFFNETLIFPARQDLNRAGPQFAMVRAVAGPAAGVSVGEAVVAAAVAELLPGLIAANPGVPQEILISGITSDSQVLAAATEAGAAFGNAVGHASGEIDYRYSLTFEIEPVFTAFIAKGIRLTAGLPVNYQFSPAPDFFARVRLPEPYASNPALAAAATEAEKAIVQNMKDLAGGDSHLLSINPNAGIFLMTLPLPLEFKFQYNIPVWGVNANAQHSASLQIRAYFAF